MNLKKVLFLFVVLGLFSSCSLMNEKPIDLSLKHSNDKGPRLNLKDYLNGSLEGYGFLEDSKGAVIKRFAVQLQGSWDEDNGIIKRKFIFDNGDKDDSRTWLVTFNKDNFVAVGHEVIGTAKGQQYRSIAQMNYQIEAVFDNVKQKTNIKEVTYNIDNKSSISILEFKAKGKYKGKMIVSLRKVPSKVAPNFDKELDKELKVKPQPEPETVSVPQATPAQ